MCNTDFKSIILCWSGFLRLVSLHLAVGLLFSSLGLQIRWSNEGDVKSGKVALPLIIVCCFGCVFSSGLLLLLGTKVRGIPENLLKFLDRCVHVALGLTIILATIPLHTQYRHERNSGEMVETVGGISLTQERLFPMVVGTLCGLVYLLTAFVLWREPTESSEKVIPETIMSAPVSTRTSVQDVSKSGSKRVYKDESQVSAVPKTLKAPPAEVGLQHQQESKLIKGEVQVSGKEVKTSHRNTVAGSNAHSPKVVLTLNKALQK